MIPGLDIPHNLIGHLALEAQMRMMHRDQTHSNRATIERHLGVTTSEALALLIESIPDEYYFAGHPTVPASPVMRRHMDGWSLARWDENRPHYMEALKR